MEDKRQGGSTSTLASKLGRRSFLKGAGIAGAGLAGAAVAGSRLGLLDKVPGAAAFGAGSSRVEASGFKDPDVLNFALNLEYLEAEFYTVAVTGKTLAQSGFDLKGTGASGATTGGSKVNFASNGSTKEASGKLATIAQQIMMDEQEHVKLLRSALGSYAIAKPTINLNALGVGFASFQQFLTLARAFEDTGSSAYGGAAPLLTDKMILATAARIGLLEAYHASNIRLLIAENNVSVTATDKFDVIPPPAGMDYFNDVNALAVVRYPSEVLKIVFANTGANVAKGGFYPDGVNGYFRTT